MQHEAVNNFRETIIFSASNHDKSLKIKLNILICVQILPESNNNVGKQSKNKNNQMRLCSESSLDNKGIRFYLY